LVRPSTRDATFTASPITVYSDGNVPWPDHFRASLTKLILGWSFFARSVASNPLSIDR